MRIMPWEPFNKNGQTGRSNNNTDDIVKNVRMRRFMIITTSNVLKDSYIQSDIIQQEKGDKEMANCNPLYKA